MPLQIVPIERFGGLRLDLDAGEVGSGGAIDLVNVDLDRLGSVRTRNGNTNIVTLGTCFSVAGIAGFTTAVNGTPQLVVAYETAAHTHRMAAYSASGGAAISTVTATPTPFRAVQWGDPSNKRLYIADGAGVWRWTGAAFSQPAGIGPSLEVTVLPGSNRLAVFDLTDANKIKFSDPGAPETFTANNYVDLAPGDGGDLVGAAPFQDRLIVFKPSRFFVFTSTSTDPTGNPIFNYYTVERYGSIIPPVSGNEGVYFFDGRYIWLTTGNVPVRISAPVEPYLQGIASLNGTTAFQPSTIALYYSAGRLWVQVATTVGAATLVYDPKIEVWTFYGSQIAGVTSAYLSTALTTYWISGPATNVAIYKFDPTATTDDGSAINWSYSSGFYPLPGANGFGESRVRYTDVWGSGTAAVKTAARGGRPSDVAEPGSGSLTLGVAPVVARDRYARSVRGRAFQHVLSGSGPAAVTRIDRWVNA
jgi:hypothetical protein